MQQTRLRAVLALLFALSGVAGLVYEIAWSKYLSLLLGSTAYAHMIVLATFMGGLAWGARWWGTRADRTDNPLRLYALLELVIALYCAVYPLLMAGAERLFLAAAAQESFAPGSIPLGALKLALSAATLLVPTFCMGGTLPILLKSFTSSLDDAGVSVARLYWVNSAGAVVGAALAGFFLIRELSLDGALWSAVLINAAVGLAAFSLSRTSLSAPAAAPASASGKAYSPRAVRLAVVAAAVGGFVSMAYELAWVRLLATLLGSSTYSFSVMLIAFIAGIALGGAIVARLLRKERDLLSLLAWCQVGTAAFMLATLPLYERLPYWLWHLSSAFQNAPEGFALFVGAEFAFCFALMIVPTTFSGMSLPVAGRIATGDITALGTSVGSIFSVNTIGAVAGALVTGLVLIPTLGVKQTLEAAVLVNAFLGVVILLRAAPAARGWAAAAVLGAAFVAYRVLVPAWDQNVSSVGVYRAFFREAPPSYAEFLSGLSERTVLSYQEGVTANVAVNEFTNDEGRRERSLVINGKADASTERDLPTQVLLAQIPMMLAPDPKDVLVIGLGSGITPGSALTHPLRRLDCVEISPEVVACNAYFAEANGRALDDPRMRMHVDDAITLVKTSPALYDVIISEPSNPWIAGIGNLFTREFFALCRTRLAPGGVLAQWFHAYDADDAVFAMVLRTLRSEFPHVTVWAPTADDVIMVASAEPIRLDEEAFARRRAMPGVGAEFERIHLGGAASLLATQVSGEGFRIEDGPLNTEKRPLLEFVAPISFFTHARVDVRRVLGEADTTTLLAGYRRRHGVRAEDEFEIARYRWAVSSDDPAFAVEPLERALKLDPDHLGALALYARVADALGRQDVRSAALRRCVELTGGRDGRYVLALAESFADAGDHAQAGMAYREAASLYKNMIAGDTLVSAGELLARSAREYLDAGDAPSAAAVVELLGKEYPDEPTLPDLRRQLVKEPR